MVRPGEAGYRADGPARRRLVVEGRSEIAECPDDKGGGAGNRAGWISRAGRVAVGELHTTMESGRRSGAPRGGRGCRQTARRAHPDRRPARLLGADAPNLRRHRARYGEHRSIVPAFARRSRGPLLSRTDRGRWRRAEPGRLESRRTARSAASMISACQAPGHRGRSPRSRRRPGVLHAAVVATDRHGHGCIMTRGCDHDPSAPIGRDHPSSWGVEITLPPGCFADLVLDPAVAGGHRHGPAGRSTSQRSINTSSASTSGGENRTFTGDRAADPGLDARPARHRRRPPGSRRRFGRPNRPGRRPTGGAARQASTRRPRLHGHVVAVDRGPSRAPATGGRQPLPSPRTPPAGERRPAGGATPAGGRPPPSPVLGYRRASGRRHQPTSVAHRRRRSRTPCRVDDPASAGLPPPGRHSR